MNISTEENANAVVVHFAGDADVFSVNSIREALERALETSGKRIICDLTGMDFICSDALGCFISAEQEAEAAGGFLRLAGPQDRIADILATTQLNRLFAVYETLDEALAV
ncbi:MAG: anti-sigma factor antagonist [Anaerolineaceae bacterium]|nr:anti-sigma factor antagonist [Anaerolineaceae bacterium]